MVIQSIFLIVSSMKLCAGNSADKDVLAEAE